LRHFDGQSWSIVDPGSSAAIGSIWGMRADQVIVAARDALEIRRFDGVNWSSLPGPGECTHSSWVEILHGSSAGIFLYVSGCGTFSFDGVTWERIPRASFPLWASADGDFFIALEPDLLYFDGYQWAVEPICTFDEWGCLGNRLVRALFGTESGTVYASVASQSTPNGSTSPEVWVFHGQPFQPVRFSVDGDLNDVAVDGTGALWFVGPAGAVYRRSGVEWRQMPTDTAADLHGVVSTGGVGSSFCEVVGADGYLRTCGWSDFWECQISFQITDNDLHDIARTDGCMVAVGADGYVSQGYSSCNLPSPEVGLADLLAVWAGAPDQVVAVGTSGTVLRYQGSTWSRPSSGTTATLRAVHGSDPSNVFAVGDHGTVVQLLDASALLHPAVTEVDLRGVLVRDPEDVYVVGTGGLAMHWDGVAWSPLTTGVVDDLHALVSDPEGRIIAAGRGGTALLLRDGAFRRLDLPTDLELRSTWGSKGDDVYSVGGDPGSDTGIILHFDGRFWDRATTPTLPPLFAVGGTSATDVYVAGATGAVFRFDGAAWLQEETGAAVTLRAVAGLAEGEAWVAGDGGTLSRRRDGAWSVVPCPVQVDLLGLWVAGPDVAFAVGAGGTVLHGVGDEWTPVSVPTGETLRAVWGSSPTEVFAVGDAGVVLRFDGTEWRSMRSGTQVSLTGIWGAAVDDVFATGELGTVLHLDRSRWAPIRTQTAESLSAIWGAGRSNVFASGEGSTLLHFSGRLRR
jgi:hypothetical protein